MIQNNSNKTCCLNHSIEFLDMNVNLIKDCWNFCHFRFDAPSILRFLLCKFVHNILIKDAYNYVHTLIVNAVLKYAFIDF